LLTIVSSVICDDYDNNEAYLIRDDLKYCSQTVKLSANKDFNLTKVVKNLKRRFLRDDFSSQDYVKKCPSVKTKDTKIEIRDEKGSGRLRKT